MSSSPVVIFDRSSQLLVEAELLPDLTVEDLERTANTYAEFRRTFMADLRFLPQNDGWNWASKARSVDAGTSRFLGLRRNGDVQGLMMLNMQPHRSRMVPTEDCLYVEFIETAPWNQPTYAGKAALFGGVGTALVRAAIAASLEAGCGGRLALHSLPQSERFYLPNFEDFGMDADENLRYFELSANAAQRLQEDTGHGASQSAE